MGVSVSPAMDQDTDQADQPRHPAPNTFKMYYALSPEMEQTNSIDFIDSMDQSIQNNKLRQRVENQNTETITEETEVVSEEDWRGSSIPPDIVASANNIKVIREEPRKYPAPVQVSFDDRDKVLYGDEKKEIQDHGDKTLADQDVTDYCSMQRKMDAYKNLEDLLDVPWEESDLAPPSKVDVVLRVGGELGERYNVFGTSRGAGAGGGGSGGVRRRTVLQKTGLAGDSEYQCGPVCNNVCALM